MKTKAQIVEDVANSQEYRNVCRKICRDNSLAADLFQDLLLILLEKEESKIVELENNGQLKFFIIRILQNQCVSISSPYYKKYKQQEANTVCIDAFPFEDITEEVTVKSETLDILDTELSRESFDNQKDWYENQMVVSLNKEGSLRKLAAKTGISRCAITSTVRSFETRVKRIERQFITFMEQTKTCLDIPEDAKRIVFAAAQKASLEPEKYIAKLIVEDAERQKKGK